MVHVHTLYLSEVRWRNSVGTQTVPTPSNTQCSRVRGPTLPERSTHSILLETSSLLTKTPLLYLVLPHRHILIRLRDLRIRSCGPEIEHLKAHNFVLSWVFVLQWLFSNFDYQLSSNCSKFSFFCISVEIHQLIWLVFVIRRLLRRLVAADLPGKIHCSR